CARLLGLSGDALPVASRLLAAVSARLGLEPGALRVVAGRLCLRGRLLGLSAGPSRSAVRPGLFQPTAPGEHELLLDAELHGQLRLPADGPVWAPRLSPLLLRRLLRPKVRASGVHALVGLPPWPRGL